MSSASESIGNVQYQPTSIAHAGGHAPIVVRCQNNVQVIVHHYRIAELGFKLKPGFGNQGLQNALRLFLPSPKRFIQKYYTRRGHGGIEAAGELFAICNMGKVFSEDFAER